ncbi:neuraminidase-like domain-containing protein [Photorhabdus australis]|uniref:Tc toxin subunit A-related protein n=1 Tax=Photorhabdus australis TaxID=286156 RepID=UPI000AE2D23A|nr:neuraminidase-like domain-containing protein [Photorhabdus australis]
MLAIEADISPELYQILTEEITDENYAELWNKNFGDISVSMFSSPDYLARYYSIDNDTLASLLSMVSLPDSDGTTLILTEVHTPGYLACQVTALGEDRYRVRFTILKNIVDRGDGLYIRRVSPATKYWDDRTFSYASNIEYSVDITVPDADFTDDMLFFYLVQSFPPAGTQSGGGIIISEVTITRTTVNAPEVFYLKLNKVLRLYKACGITPAELLQITSSLGDALTIDHAVLGKIFQVRYLMSHYQLDVARSLVLCNGTISDQAFSGETGLFTTLFNTPPLNGQTFSADDTALDLRSEAPEDAFRLSVLKRAFNVSASGLSTLWQLVSGDSSAGFTCSADNIAALYRVKLLADIHDLSAGELSMLLSVSPFSGVATGSLSDDELTQLTQFLYQTTTWLTEQGWSVSDVFLMLTTAYSTLLTPEMENLFATLRSGLSGRSFSSSDELSTAAAPLVAAATQLDSTDSAGAMLDWADALQPEGLTLADFISQVITDAQPDEEQTARLAGFCQVLWQLSLIIRHTGLSTRELTLVVSQPGRFRAGLASLPHDLQTLRDLTRYHDTVNRCGSHAADVLTALEAGELPVTLLATALEQDEQDVAGALAQVRGGSDQDGSVFATWKEVDQAEQWLDMSETLSITPSGLARLIALKYINVSDDSAPSYSEWLAVSGLLQSGLDSSQTATLSAALEESTSSALCAYYLHNLAPVMVSSRDDLFSYLLLDNQVSAQVKTTRIAEAIASIQLYVNRALNGMENSIVTEVRARQFFTDWDMYNKRYSTWAGVSELVYYPENYIDPTVRIGQTSMMDTLLQSVSQSSISRDTVEDAYRTYLTSFEQIANLRIVSGYHDHVDNDQGTTYIIGCNDAEEVTWYWRSVDHNTMDDGVFPANAWTEWLPIHCGLNPFNSVVRPVVFNNYLYIAWLERKETAKTSTDGGVSPLYSYTLNLSRLRYDGTWSSPVSFALSADAIKTVLNLTAGEAGNQGLELYLSRDNESNVLHGIFYCFWDADTQWGIVGTSSQSDSYFIHIDEFLSMTEVTDKSEQERVYKNTVGLYASIKHSRIIDRVFVDRLSFSYTTKIDPSAVYDLSTHRIVDFSGTEIQRAYIKSNDEQTITVGVESFVSCTLSQQTYTNQAVLKLFTSYYSASDVIYVTTIPSSTIADVSFACMVNATTKNIVCLFYKDYAAGYADPVPTIISHRIIVSGLVAFEGGITGSQTYFTASLTEAQINSAILGLLNFNITAYLLPAVTGTSQAPVFQEYVDSYLYPVNTTSLQGEYLLSYGSLVINSAGSAVFTPVGSSLPLSLGKNTLTPDTMALEVDISSEEVNICVAVSHKNAPETYLAMRYMTVSILYIGSVATGGTQYISLSKTRRGAQYMSMAVNGEAIKVRLNTLFARQLVARANVGIDAVLTLETQKITEPALDYDSNDNVLMDFTGANALYFWELFYYTPMMVFQRLLQEQNFPEATRWLQYVWNPAGYIVNGTQQNYTWNVRPLEEDTSWNDSPLDSVNPDAIAQNDPMHYKVATFMRMLDLLIARGDAAYRLLERDTLNEARMWYVQALNILGEEPYISFDADWSALTLGDAASEVTARSYQSALLAVRRQEAAPDDARTANSLTALFLPQQNAVLKGYWQTLAQRLYNLRHNLSIDGQPLSLSVYATPAEPAALLNAAVSSAQGSSSLPVEVMPLYRFPVMLENARGQVSLLQQFGSTLLSITERQDAEAMAELLQTQGSELILQGLRQQDNALAEIDADILALEESRRGAQARFDYYSRLYDADVNTGEKQAMDLYLSSSVLAASGQALFMAGAAADMLPNIYGMAVGGSRFGALFNATAIGIQVSSDATRISADKISQSEMYRRRREEWEIQRDGAQSDVSTMDAQLAAMAVRREGAQLQKTYLETQQAQTQAQLAYLQNKFSNTALYSWLRGKLAALYYQFYDLTVSRCLMAQSAYQWDRNSTTRFIQSGAWQGTYAGLLAGETLMLGLSQMEQAWLKNDEREKEVTRTVCLSEVYAGLAGEEAFVLADEVARLVNAGEGSAGTETSGLAFSGQQLQATLRLTDLNIVNDYPSSLGVTRRIKQISVTLPALVGPYQDVRAVLSYGGSIVVPRGCEALAVSHGMNDSGQFQLDFNDPRWLPFEGIPVDDSGTLTLSFPEADGKQQAMLLSLSDIILHIRYTIFS